MPLTNTMLRCFAAVAECGNLADAAARLGRTPSAISMTLKQMEDHLGARLFETDRKNRLTLLGEEVFDLAQRQVQQHDNSVAAIEALARAPKGLLRIATIPSIAQRGLPSAIKIILRRYPSLQVEIQDADSDIVKRTLLSGLADIGIVSGQPDLNGFKCTPLFEDAFGLVAAPDHPLIRRAEALTLADLTTSEFVRNDLCAQIPDTGFQTFLQHTQITARNTLSLISMVRTGSWMTVLPYTVVGILPDNLAFREISGLEHTRTVSLLTREHSLFPDLVRDFANILTASDWKDETSATREAPPARRAVKLTK